MTAIKPSRPREPSIPFGGLAESLVLTSFRAAGVPLQRIRPALAVLTRELGVQHALASRQLYTDGAEVLFDFAENAADAEVVDSIKELVVLRSGQRVFADVVRQYLKRITYAADGWASRLELPQYQRAKVFVDPTINFGQPFFASGGVRVEDVLERWWAGEDMQSLAEDFGVPLSQIEEAARVAGRPRAA